MNFREKKKRKTGRQRDSGGLWRSLRTSGTWPIGSGTWTMGATVKPRDRRTTIRWWIVCEEKVSRDKPTWGFSNDYGDVHNRKEFPFLILFENRVSLNPLANHQPQTGDTWPRALGLPSCCGTPMSQLGNNSGFHFHEESSGDITAVVYRGSIYLLHSITLW